MTSSLVGCELVSNFQLLLQYFSSEDCAQLIDTGMLSLPDKRTFQGVMMYVLDVMNENWRSKLSGALLTKKDERLFYNILCDHLKILRKEFPLVKLPIMSPSSMVCFHGEKSRENLLKITKALMLFVMKKMNYQDETCDSTKDVMLELQTISEECNRIKEEIQQKREQLEKIASHEKKVLQLIISAGNWDEAIKSRLLDVNDKTIIPDMLMKYEAVSKELASLKQNLQPFIKHIHHESKNEECKCLPKYQLSSKQISKIGEMLWEANKNTTKFYIRNLKLASEIKMLNISIMRESEPNLEVDDHIPTELIQQLEILVNEETNIPKQTGPFLVDSPFPVNTFSPKDNTSLEFNPVVACNWLKINNPPIKMDVESVADLIVPVKVGVQPSLPLSGHIIGSVQRPKLKPNETIRSIAQRMTSKVTPNKLGLQKSNSYSDVRSLISSSTITGQPPNKDTVTFLKEKMKLEPITPAQFNAEMPAASQTTGRRLSSGFMKPGSCFVRRQLNTDVSQLKTRLFARSSRETPKSISNEINKISSTTKPKNEDDNLNMIVQKMVTEEICDESFSRNDSDMLDSSLSGIECISSTPRVENKMQSNENSEFLSPLNPNMSIVEEVLEDDNEILAAVNSFQEACSRTELSESKEQLDGFLNSKEMEKMYDSFYAQKELDNKKKTGRDSMGALVEKFNAIMAKKKKK